MLGYLGQTGRHWGGEEKGGRKSVLGRNVDRLGRYIAGSGD
jgi:hypothetical protein